MTKVTPTVTNVNHANIDLQHKDLTQSVKDSERHTVFCVLHRHTVIYLQKHADNFIYIYLNIIYTHQKNVVAYLLLRLLTIPFLT